VVCWLMSSLQDAYLEVEKVLFNLFSIKGSKTRET
jgi:hypothetical protein